jgi:uncharacterized PurR-regulated membrane protein YhhQ (DUF165 family)
MKTYAAAAGLLTTIILANWLTTEYGFVAVGFGLTATAGTYAAGLALGLRDVLQDNSGRFTVLAVILLGGGLSYLVADPFIALASAVAFTASELLDWAVYTPLRGKATSGSSRWSGAVLASNLLGAVLDTALFVGIAFGAAAIQGAMLGQLVGKGWASLAIIIPFFIYRTTRERRLVLA